MTRLDELGERLDLPIDEHRVETVGGLIMLHLDRIPRAGDVVRAHGCTFEVLSVSRHAVSECAVTVDEA